MKNCTQCNFQNTDDAKFCRQCGAILPEPVPYAAPVMPPPVGQSTQNYTTQQYGQYTSPIQPVQEQQKNKKKGCLIAVLVAVGVIVLLFFLVILFAPSEPSSPSYDEEPVIINGADVSENLTLNTTIPDQQSEAPQTEQPTTQNSMVGSYGVQIKEWKVVRENDADVLIVTYIFSNYSNSSTSFMMSIYDKAFQKGIETTKEFLLWDNDFDGESDDKDVQPGYSLEVQEAYRLNDTTSPVEIEIKESFTLFADEILHFTINIAEQ